MNFTSPIIVVIDSNKTYITFFEQCIKELAIDLKVYDNTTDAYEYLKNNEPKLIFLDIIVSGKNGLNFLRNLRDISILQDVPVVITTSKDYEQDRSIAKKLNVVDFMIKPIPTKQIKDVILKYI